MDKRELKQMVAQLLKEMEGSSAAVSQTSADGCLPDITKEDQRQIYLVPDPEHGEAYLRLKKKTPARLGLGRAGARYRTRSMLRFRADHAAARSWIGFCMWSR